MIFKYIWCRQFARFYTLTLRNYLHVNIYIEARNSTKANYWEKPQHGNPQIKWRYHRPYGVSPFITLWSYIVLGNEPCLMHQQHTFKHLRINSCPPSTRHTLEWTKLNNYQFSNFLKSNTCCIIIQCHLIQLIKLI